jgi:hypothetical protein
MRSPLGQSARGDGAAAVSFGLPAGASGTEVGAGAATLIEAIAEANLATFGISRSGLQWLVAHASVATVARPRGDTIRES